MASGAPAVRTHASIDPALSGRVETLAPGRAVLVLETTERMVADEQGLVHGGFVFSLADHAAMQAIGEPTVVLGSADVRFVRPVRRGEVLKAVAEQAAAEGKKLPVDVTVSRSLVGGGGGGSGGGGDGDEEVVMTGRFICFVPSRHVLEAADS